MELLRRSGLSVQGKTVVVIGDSNIVGMPLSMLLRDHGAASVTVVHRTSYRELFDSGEDALRRARARACLPGVPSQASRHPYEMMHASSLREAYPYQDQPANAAGTGAGAPEPEAPAHLANLCSVARTADVLIVAVGFPRLVKADWIKPGAVVIDVGINVEDWGDGLAAEGGSSEHQPLHVVGDVDFPLVAEVASAITPVPGGIGPMTIAAVLHNTIKSAELSLLKKE
jgi:5,10-methylene-tetrahydrofolate dehydrogenase/methenyl tetrahydrofolate cyclohydrolase